MLGGDEFSSEALSSLLSPDPSYSEKTLRRALGWLNSGYQNGDMRSFDVRARWNEFQAYVAEWRKNLRLEMRSSTDRRARREAETLLTLANAWAAGDLAAVRTCVLCAEFFLAERSNNQFCNEGCRSTFYHEIETLHPEYKERKAREAEVRRMEAKAKHLADYVRDIFSMYGKLPESQLDAHLVAAARKFKMTPAAVERIARAQGLAKG